MCLKCCTLMKITLYYLMICMYFRRMKTLKTFSGLKHFSKNSAYDVPITQCYHICGIHKQVEENWEITCNR